MFNNHDVKKFYVCFVTGYIGLMYSHLVMSVYFTLFLLVFLLSYIKDIFKKKNFWHLCLSALMILIFTSTFTVPMIEHKLSGVEYAAFVDREWTYDYVWTMPFSGYFTEYYYGTGSDINPGLIYSNLNFIVIVFFVLALIRIFRKQADKKLSKFLLAIACFGILGIVLNSFKGIWLHVPSLLLSIQFPWRLSQFVGFGFALVAAFGLDSYLTIFKTKFIPVALMIIFVFLGAFTIINNNKTSFMETLSDYEVSVAGAAREHYPLKIMQNMEDFWKKENKITVLDGNADVKILENDVPYMKFEVKNIDDEVKIELPRFYYLGYEITDEDGKVIEYDYHNPGYISLKVDKEGVYEVHYTGTTAYKFAFVIKLLMIVVIACFIVYDILKKKKIVNT